MLTSSTPPTPKSTVLYFSAPADQLANFFEIAKKVPGWFSHKRCAQFTSVSKNKIVSASDSLDSNLVTVMLARNYLKGPFYFKMRVMVEEIEYSRVCLIDGNACSVYIIEESQDETSCSRETMYSISDWTADGFLKPLKSRLTPLTKDEFEYLTNVC